MSNYFSSSKLFTLFYIFAIVYYILMTMRFINNSTIITGSSLITNDTLEILSKPFLLNYIRSGFLYKINNNKKPHNSISGKETAKLLEAVNYKKSGFFVECGAYDGITDSTTLYLENNLNWTGLLIEPDNYDQLKLSGRNVWISNMCLNNELSSTTVHFTTSAIGLGKIDQTKNINTSIGDGAEHKIIHCFTLFSVMLAMNKTQIDYFSLNVNGDEYAILTTIPFNLIQIKVISVAYHNNSELITSYLIARGYKKHPQDIILSRVHHALFLS